MDNVLCEGTEQELAQCRTAEGWGSSDCGHAESAGVVCLDPDLDGQADGAPGPAAPPPRKPKTRIKVSGIGAGWNVGRWGMGF